MPAVEPGPLEVQSLPGATAYPRHPAPEPRTVRAGVLRADGSVLESTLDDRRHGDRTYVAPEPAQLGEPEHVAREAIYAGVFHDVYGHFLLEGLQRLWWAAEHPDLPIVWVADAGLPAPTLSAWQRDMLEVVGIRNEVLVLTRPTTFSVLHVPDAGYKYADWSHPDHIDFLASYDGPPQEDGRRLWLSRDGRTGVGVINREIIERRLEAQGWTIVTPELMPLRDQLDALARAEVVAGEEGSTFHTLLLLRDIERKRFHVFRRHGPEHLSFTTIGDARRVDQQIHSCSHDAVLSVDGRAVVRLAPNAAQYLSHLRIRIPRPRALPEGWKPSATIRRVNALAEVLGARTLLQVGWRGQAIFTQLVVPHRDVVDEHFRFDVRSYRDQGAHFYELSLDRFLDRFAEGRRYDLVLVDDPHDWRTALEQIRTVFAAAAHDGTVLVLDNVLPVDAASTAPDRETAMRLRQEAGSERKAWHGDVFKTVFALHDLHPELSYRTITTGGNPQTVVWREPRRVRPRFSGEAEIGRLSYADVDRHRDLYAAGPEADVIAGAARAVHGRTPRD